MWRSCSNPVHINPKYFFFARDQIDEGCLLHNIEGWESWSLADTADLVSNAAL